MMRMTPQEKARQRRQITQSYPLPARIVMSLAFCALFAIMFHTFGVTPLPNSVLTIILSWMFFKALA